MLIRYDEQDEETLRRLFGNNLIIDLDVAKGKDKCFEVTYCIRNKDDILKVETLQIKEYK